MEDGDPTDEIDKEFRQSIGPATSWLMKFASQNNTFKLWPSEYTNDRYIQYKDLGILNESPDYKNYAKERIVLSPKFIYDEFW